MNKNAPSVHIMGIKRSLVLGFKSLRRRLLRSILTLLGIVFGVGAVVAMLAIGEGASFESQERIRRLGSRNIIVRSIKPAGDLNKRTPSHGIASAVYGLTDDDADRIRATVPGITGLLPIRETRQDVWHRALKIDARVQGSRPEHLSVTGLVVTAGRFITATDMARKAPVCVIGQDVRRAIFPYSDPVGQTVKIGRSYYRVVGTIRSAPGISSPQNDGITAVESSVIIPFTAFEERFGKTIIRVKAGSFERETVELHLIFARIEETDAVIPASQAIQHLLDRYHSQKDYEMIVPLKLLEEIQRSARMFSLVLGMIAAISLLVGGIGIMNIMLANVTERTREIGVRRALGAKKRDIILQFLSETLVLSIVGGILGIGIGAIIPLVIREVTGMTIIFTLWSFVLAFSISALVGIVFGVYPAWRAANLDPIQALRPV